MSAHAPQTPLWKRVFSLPMTSLGWYSLGLLVVHALLFAVWNALVATGLQGGETFFSNPWLAIPLLTAGVSAIAAGAVALVAMIGRGERSILMVIPLLYGLFVFLFWLGELLSPH